MKESTDSSLQLLQEGSGSPSHDGDQDTPPIMVLTPPRVWPSDSLIVLIIIMCCLQSKGPSALDQFLQYHQQSQKDSEIFAKELEECDKITSNVSIPSYPAMEKLSVTLIFAHFDHLQAKIMAEQHVETPEGINFTTEVCRL